MRASISTMSSYYYLQPIFSGKMDAFPRSSWALFPEIVTDLSVVPFLWLIPLNPLVFPRLVYNQKAIWWVLPQVQTYPKTLLLRSIPVIHIVDFPKKNMNFPVNQNRPHLGSIDVQTRPPEGWRSAQPRCHGRRSPKVELGV